MCPMIRTPPPPFLQTFNLRGPAADVLFIKGDANGKEEGKKREEKKSTAVISARSDTSRGRQRRIGPRCHV